MDKEQRRKARAARHEAAARERAGLRDRLNVIARRVGVPEPSIAAMSDEALADCIVRRANAVPRGVTGERLVRAVVDGMSEGA